MQTQQMDTFGDMTPVEPIVVAATAADSTGGGEGIDSFDNMDVVTELPKEEEEVKTEAKKDGDSQVDQLDEEEDKIEKKAEEKPKEEEKKVEEPKEEEKAEEVKEEKPQGKTVRLKDGDKAVDLSEEATVKVKVKGKNEFVSLADLKKNYSGHVVYDEKIKEADTKLRESEEKSEKFEGQKNAIVNDLKKVVSKMDDVDGNPLDAMKYLLEITNRPVHTYMKRALEAQLDQLSELQEMTETERELYWTKQESEWLRNNQATQDKRLSDENAHRALTQKVDNLREQYGVGEEEYIEVQRELETTGREITPELVVQAAMFKPVHAQAQEFVMTNFSEDLGDNDLQNLTAGTAQVLFNNPKATNEEAVRLAARSLGYEVSTMEDDVKELESKNVRPASKATDNSHLRYGKELEDDEVDSFDSFDYL